MKRFIQHFSFTLILTVVPASIWAQSPLNWARDEINPGEDFTLSADESLKTEGTRSLYMRLHSGAVPYLVSDVFYITPGVDYEFSIDVFDNDTSGQVKVYADFYDTYGFNIFGQPPVFSVDSSEWQTIQWQGTVPTQAVVGYILIKFYCQPDLYHFVKEAGAWLDNVRFIQEGGINLVANGGFETWNVGIDEPGGHSEIVVFPNPAKDMIRIDLPLDTREVFVKDVAGRSVFSKVISGENPIYIDTRGWISGIYIVGAIYENIMISTKKFIKN